MMAFSFFKSCGLRLALLAVLCLQAGCAVITVVDAAVSVTATVVKTGVNAAGAVVVAVLPSKDKK